MIDRFNLQRFADAQAGVYETAVTEIKRGAKRSHWMWYIFPQLAALGQSATAKHYGIGSIEEARAYLDQPILGRRLRECAEALLALPTTTAEHVFGPVDAIKLRSSLTLFKRAGTSKDAPFIELLNRWFDGEDQKTAELLQGQSDTRS